MIKEDSSDSSDSSSLHSMYSPDDLEIGQEEILQYPSYTCRASIAEQTPFSWRIPGIECIYSTTTGILHVVVDDLHLRIENVVIVENVDDEIKETEEVKEIDVVEMKETEVE